jgi:hypothetical protein
MFPLGLAGSVNRRFGNEGGWTIFVFCIAVYLIQGFFYFRSRLRALLWFGLLIILLLANVSGCRAMLNTH